MFVKPSGVHASATGGVLKGTEPSTSLWPKGIFLKD